MNVRHLYLLSAGLGLLVPAGLAWSYPVTPCATATATCRTLSFSSTSPDNLLRSAQAIVQVDTAVAGTDLYITLSNITPQDLKVNSEILTSFFWNIKNTSGTYVADWIGTSATTKVTSGTPVFNAHLKNMQSGAVTQAPNANGVDENIGGEWVYKNSNTTDGLGANSTFTGMRSGVSTTGLGGTFGDSDALFCSSSVCNIDGKGFNTGGIRFGITSLNDNPVNNGSDSQQPMVQDTIRFKLHSSNNSNFDLTQIGSLSGAFQYGTGLTEPRFYTPEPGMLALLGLGALAFMLGGRRSRGLAAA